MILRGITCLRSLENRLVPIIRLQSAPFSSSKGKKYKSYSLPPIPLISNYVIFLWSNFILKLIKIKFLSFIFPIQSYFLTDFHKEQKPAFFFNAAPAPFKEVRLLQAPALRPCKLALSCSYGKTKGRWKRGPGTNQIYQ